MTIETPYEFSIDIHGLENYSTVIGCDRVDIRSAVEDYAEYIFEQMDGNEYMLNRDVVIRVRKEGSEEYKQFTISTRINPVFEIREK